MYILNLLSMVLHAVCKYISGYLDGRDLPPAGGGCQLYTLASELRVEILIKGKYNRRSNSESIMNVCQAM